MRYSTNKTKCNNWNERSEPAKHKL